MTEQQSMGRTLADCAHDLRDGATTSVEVIAHSKRRIEAADGTIGAFLEVFDDIEEQARAADARRTAGEDDPLLGIPIALKDNMLIAGRTVSAGSRMLEQYTATYNATVTQRLRDAGAVLLGRTNMDEFAMGSTTENSAFGPTRNPVAQDYVPGGSSGGSAAAVAMGAVPAALGSDTGGSIRTPAAFCGLVGLKPTYGSVSRSGLIAFGSSLDIIGPIARTVSDAETVYRAIAGHDHHDATSIAPGTYPTVSTHASRIGIPWALLKKYLSSDVLAVYEGAAQHLQQLGYTVVDIRMPDLDDALAAYYIVMFAESSTNLARFDGVRYGLRVSGEDRADDYAQTRAAGFGPEVRRRIMLGTYVLSAGYVDAYYGKAEALRRSLTDELNTRFSEVDAIALPTTPTPAFRIGEKADPLSVYLTDVFTVPANLAGIPALSVPAGTTADNLPLGLQFFAPHEGEGRLFALGRAFTGKEVS